MRRFISLLAFAGAASVMLALGAAVAGASTWDITKLPTGPAVGHVATAGTTAFNVTNASGTLVGRVVKTKSGAWKVMRGGTKIAVVKANGSNAYPVNIYSLSGKKIGSAGRTTGPWRVDRIYANVPVRDIRGYAPKACPGRAVAGAVRLVNWK